MDELDKIAKILEDQGKKDSDTLSKSAQTSLDLANKIADQASNSASEMVATYKVAITEIKKVIAEYKEKTKEKNIEVKTARLQVENLKEDIEQEKNRIVAAVRKEDEKEKKMMKMEFAQKLSNVEKNANEQVGEIQLELTRIQAENDNLRTEMKTNARMHDAEKTSLENQLQILSDQTNNQINQKERLHNTIVKKMKKQLETIKNSRAETENELDRVREELSDVNENFALAQSKVTKYEDEKNKAMRRNVRQATTFEELGIRNVDEPTSGNDESVSAEEPKAPEKGTTVGNMTAILGEEYKKLRY